MIDSNLSSLPESGDVSASEEFRRGARALFDCLQWRAANNFHGNPAANARCDRENALVLEWASEALEEVDPQSHAEWKSVNDAYRDGYEAGKRAAARAGAPAAPIKNAYDLNR